MLTLYSLIITYLIISDKKPIYHKYGEYGWIKLTDIQYEKLLKDLGQVELDRCIAYIDELAQSTGNKNKWKDWNLVIRRCNREGWGKTSQKQKENSINGKIENDPLAGLRIGLHL